MPPLKAEWTRRSLSGLEQLNQSRTHEHSVPAGTWWASTVVYWLPLLCFHSCLLSLVSRFGVFKLCRTDSCPNSCRSAHPLLNPFLGLRWARVAPSGYRHVTLHSWALKMVCSADLECVIHKPAGWLVRCDAKLSLYCTVVAGGTCRRSRPGGRPDPTLAELGQLRYDWTRHSAVLLCGGNLRRNEGSERRRV